MPIPITPLVGCDTFILNEKGDVLLIQRSDSGLWALPGGFQELGESPAECAARECKEETGLDVQIERLLGVFSSTKYPYVHYQWKDNEIVHILFAGRVTGGAVSVSEETTAVAWFSKDSLPPLFDGHSQRIEVGFAQDRGAYFE